MVRRPFPYPYLLRNIPFPIDIPVSRKGRIYPFLHEGVPIARISHMFIVYDTIRILASHACRNDDSIFLYYRQFFPCTLMHSGVYYSSSLTPEEYAKLKLDGLLCSS